MQLDGADANAARKIEFNFYYVPTDPNMTGADVEQNAIAARKIDVLRAVKAEVTIPVGIKLSPYFSNLANVAKRLEEAGANSLVLFNRFYQPDIDLEELEVRPNILLSTGHEVAHGLDCDIIWAD